ncbi:MAG: ribose 5-phosphate isomerase B [Candidatus Micrarchaeota archaeon]|nr:ribose 5-phosphate isomerase B [Candidatus Micrarchaeota archaeon]
MRIALGSDHGGYAAKEALKPVLASLGHEAKDFGTTSAEPVDYPVYAFKVGEEVAAGRFERGILLCGTGIGMGIAANKVKGIRAAVCWSADAARLSRAHNDANVLCIGARLLSAGQIEEIVRVWLLTAFSGDERHVRRINQVREREERWRG